MDRKMKVSGIRIFSFLALGFLLMAVGATVGPTWLGLIGFVVVLTPLPRRLGAWLDAEDKQ